jgi:hypothetical protein
MGFVGPDGLFLLPNPASVASYPALSVFSGHFWMGEWGAKRIHRKSQFGGGIY